MQSKAKTFLAVAAMALGVSFVLIWAYLGNHHFFFIDDRQSQYFPYALAMQRELLHGRFPFQILSTFFGGALWLDWQYGIFNPLELAKLFLVDPHALDLSGLNLAIVSNTMLSICAYFLARAYSLSRGYSAVFGLAVGLNFYILSWNSGNWQPGVSGASYFCLIWGLLKLSVDSKRISPGLIAAGAGAIYLLLSSGWPNAYVAIAMVSLVFLMESISSRNRSASINIGLIFLFGFLFSLPVTMPVLLSFPYTGRDNGFWNDHYQVPFFGGLLNFSNPFWLPFHLAFVRLETLSGPYYYLSWFVMPLAIMIDWKKITFTKEVKSIAAISLLLLLLALGPEQLGPLRWPIRFVPFLQISVLLMFLLVMDSAQFVTHDRRKVWVGGFWLLSSWMAVVENPDSVKQILLVLPVAAFSYAAFWMMNRSKRSIAIFLFSTTLFISFCLVATYPVNNVFPDYGKNSGNNNLDTSIDRPFTGYALTLGPALINLPKGDERTFLQGAMHLYYNIDSVNGYSSIGHRVIQNKLCLGMKFEIFCTRGVEYLLDSGTDSGMKRLNLLKVNHISARKGFWSEMMSKYLVGWKKSETDEAVLFDRDVNFRFPGTIAWATKDIKIKMSEMPTGTSEKFLLTNDGGDGTIEFTRLFYPGYQLTLNDVPLEIQEMDDFFVGAKIPKGATGLAELSFTPPHFYFFLAIALVAFAALLVWNLYCYAIKPLSKHH
jgi:hypothetical protein